MNKILGFYIRRNEFYQGYANYKDLYKIFFLDETNIAIWGGKNKNIRTDVLFYFFSTFSKIKCGGFVNQLIKKYWPNRQYSIRQKTIQRCQPKIHRIL